MAISYGKTASSLFYNRPLTIPDEIIIFTLQGPAMHN